MERNFNYPTPKVISNLLVKCSVLITTKENYKIAKSCHGELITTLPGDPKTGSTDIKIRVIEVILDDGSKEYLATNVFDTSLNADDFKELYSYFQSFCIN